MKHRNTPRGGSRNTQAEIYDEDGEPNSSYDWDGLCLADKHGLDYEGQTCDLCKEEEQWCYEDSMEECPTGGWLTGMPSFVTCHLCIEKYKLKEEK